VTARGRRPPDGPGEDEGRLYARALRLLAAEERSEADLRRALARYGEAAAVERVLERLRARRYVDDGRFAAAFTQSRALERGAGARWVRAALAAHGVAADVAAREAARAGEAERETARRLARRALAAMADVPAAVRARRLAGRLARRGYRPGVVYDVVREALGGQDGGEAAEVLEALARAEEGEGEGESGPPP
jgi:regulatory protein